jgi:MoxR-like ATPase
MVGVLGRSAEFALVTGFMADFASGPVALVVEGEAGIGKTALFEAAPNSRGGWPW